MNTVFNSTPTHLCERKYLIAEGDLTEGSLEFDPSADLQEKIEDFVTTFVFWRADVKLQILFRAVPQLYGYAVMSWIPQGSYPVGYFDEGSQYQASPVLIDISSQEIVEYRIPWTCPTPYLRRNIGFASANLTLGGIKTMSTDMPVSLPYQIWANYENFDAMGATAQMQGSGLPLMSRGLDLAMSAGNVMSAVSSNLMKAGKGYATLNQAYGAMTGLYSGAEEAEQPEEGVSNEGMSVKQSVFGDMATMGTSGNLNYIGDRKMPMYEDEDLGSLKPFLSYQELLRVPSIYQEIVFNELETEFAFTARPDAHFNSTLSGTYLEFFSRFYRFWRGSMKYSFHFFTSPLISARFQLNIDWGSSSGDAGDNFTEVWPVRGSVVYDITVPYIFPSQWRITGEQGGQNLVPRVRCSMTMNPVGAGDVAPEVFCLVFVSAGEDFVFSSMEAFWNGTLDPPPPNVKEAEAQCDLRQHHRGNFPVIGQGRTNLTYLFNPPAEGPVQVVRRYSTRTGAQSPAVPGPVPPSTRQEFLQASNFDMLATIFRYWRGTTRIKVPISSESDLTYVQMQNTNESQPTRSRVDVSNGAVVNRPTIWSILEVEIPFLSRQSAAYMVPPTIGIDENQPIGVEVQDLLGEALFIAAGADYAMYYLMPLPAYTLWAMSDELNEGRRSKLRYGRRDKVKR